MLTQTPIPYPPFLGDEVTADYDAARVVILPIPYEATTTYRQGCKHGPAAILDASQQVEYYDEELEQELWPVGIHTHGPIADTHRQPQISSVAMLEETETTVRSLWDDGKFVIGLGGEHSITEGVVRAYYGSSPDFTVVQIDAHGDLRHEYEGSIHNHACVMRRVVDLGLPTVQIGIRSICKEEADLIRDKHLCVFRAREIARSPDWIDRALASISTRSVFLTIDLDGIDPNQMPGVGTPEPGGLDWYSLMEFLRRLFEQHDVLGCDVMELAPVPGSVVSEFTAAKLVYKLIGYQAIAQKWLMPVGSLPPESMKER
jgi:agmatinase